MPHQRTTALHFDQLKLKNATCGVCQVSITPTPHMLPSPPHLQRVHGGAISLQVDDLALRGRHCCAYCHGRSAAYGTTCQAQVVKGWAALHISSHSQCQSNLIRLLHGRLILLFTYYYGAWQALQV
jgi:hypothetical protein